MQAYDVVCRQLVAASGCVVLSVDYRLAPEHRHPTAVADAIAVTAWAYEHAQALGTDPARLAIASASSAPAARSP